MSWVIFVLIAVHQRALDADQSTEGGAIQAKFMRAERRNSEVNLHGSASLLGSGFAEESQLLRRSAIEIDRALQALSRDLSTEEPTTQLLHALKLCAPCREYKRFGKDHGGGYVMCMDDLFFGQQLLKGAYSYGIAGEDSWGMDVAQHFKVPVYEYDCTESWRKSTQAKIPTPCDGCNVTYYDECLSPAEEGSIHSYTTLQRQLVTNRHLHISNGTLLMKMAIDGGEWSFFEEEPPENLKKFNQVVVEFHDLHDKQNHGQYLTALRKIKQAGLEVAHLHGSNKAGVEILHDQYSNLRSIPRVLEVTFMQRNKPCSEVLYQYIKNNVDQADDETKKELPPSAYASLK